MIILSYYPRASYYFASQGVLSGGTEGSSTNEATEVEVAAAVSGTPANAWISPEKHAQTFHIDLSEFDTTCKTCNNCWFIFR
jgi:hypothetical protein